MARLSVLRRPYAAACDSVELRLVIAKRHGCGIRRVQPGFQWHMAEVPRLPGTHDAAGHSVTLARLRGVHDAQRIAGCDSVRSMF